MDHPMCDGIRLFIYYYDLCIDIILEINPVILSLCPPPSPKRFLHLLFD